jgi:hypothetical protein
MTQQPTSNIQLLATVATVMLYHFEEEEEGKSSKKHKSSARSSSLHEPINNILTRVPPAASVQCDACAKRTTPSMGASSNHRSVSWKAAWDDDDKENVESSSINTRSYPYVEQSLALHEWQKNTEMMYQHRSEDEDSETEGDSHRDSSSTDDEDDDEEEELEDEDEEEEEEENVENLNDGALNSNEESSPYWMRRDWMPTIQRRNERGVIIEELKSPEDIRLELTQYMKANAATKKKTALLADFGVNSNSFRKFMDHSNYKDPWRAGTFNGIDLRLHDFTRSLVIFLRPLSHTNTFR